MPQEPEVLMEINTTPLIDILFVFIVMLIITIPAQLHSVNLDMPVSQPQKIIAHEVIKISINEKNQIFWNGHLINSDSKLEEKFSELNDQSQHQEIHVYSNGKAKYEVAIKAWKAMTAAKIHHFLEFGSA